MIAPMNTGIMLAQFAGNADAYVQSILRDPSYPSGLPWGLLLIVGAALLVMALRKPRLRLNRRHHQALEAIS
jgi:hypothetical protein